MGNTKRNDENFSFSGNTTILKANGIGVPTAVVVTRPPVNSIPTISTSQVSIAAQQNNKVKLQEPAQTVLQVNILKCFN